MTYRMFILAGRRLEDGLRTAPCLLWLWESRGADLLKSPFDQGPSCESLMHVVLASDAGGLKSQIRQQASTLRTRIAFRRLVDATGNWHALICVKITVTLDVFPMLLEPCYSKSMISEAVEEVLGDALRNVYT
jgi:hypothetical protein